jgi:integrase
VTARRTSIKKYPGVYRSNSGKYEIAFRDEEGRLRFQTVPGDLQDAVAEREKVMGRKRRGEPVGRSRVSFGDYAESWHAGLNKRPRTLEGYRYQLEAHLLPRFKRRRLTEIRTDDVARLVREMSDKGFSASTIDAALTCLSSLYRKAVRAGLVAANPVRGLEPDERPKHERSHKRILSEEEIGKLLATAGASRALLALLLFSGLRIAEALGLSWDDVDFERGFIRVERQLSRNERRRVELKTEAACREVVLMGQLATVLREHRMASRFKQPGDLVFTTPAGRGRDHRATTRSIRAAIKRAKLSDGGQLSAHSLRHGFASMLIVDLRYDPVNVARQLGHADPATTLRTYAHLFEKARHSDELRDGLGERFGHLLVGSR